MPVTSSSEAQTLPASSLLSLPVDVLNEVVAYVRPFYLRDLRLASRQVRLLTWCQGTSCMASCKGDDW
jgi:hypothetical protein